MFKLSKIIAVLAVLAEQTATQVDDELVDVLRAIDEEGLLGSWFKGRMDADATPEGTLRLMADPPAEITEAFKARGIDFQRVLELLPVIITIVRTLAGK